MTHLPVTFDPAFNPTSLPPFTYPARCPKCLGTRVFTRFYKANMDGPHEYVTRECICTHSWREMPADQGPVEDLSVCPNNHYSLWDDFHDPQTDGTCIVHQAGGHRVLAAKVDR